MPKTDPTTLYVYDGRNHATPGAIYSVAKDHHVLAHPACAAVVAERDRLVVLLRAALDGKLAGPWGPGHHVAMRSERGGRGNVLVIWHASMGWARSSASLGTIPERQHHGTQADADAWLIAHGWTLMTPADQALLDRGGEG